MIEKIERSQIHVEFDVRGKEVRVRKGSSMMTVSLDCPQLVIKGAETGEWLISSQTDAVYEEGESYSTTFRLGSSKSGAVLNVDLHVQWDNTEEVIRKWAVVRADLFTEECVLQEVILESSDVESNRLMQFNPHYSENHMQSRMQSQPVFFAGYFAGVEFPVSSTRMEAGTLYIAHRPGAKLVPGSAYESRKAVFGIAEQGEEKAAFQVYLRRHCQISGDLHVNYNSWYTSPVPYTREEIVGIMKEFEESLYDKHGVSLDTFCIDLGWSDKQSIWEINKTRFPEGFKELERQAGEMDSELGLWISPTACYSEALDNDWAKEQGYGTSTTPWTGDHNIRFVCLGDDKYQSVFKNRIVKLVQDYPIRQIKFDGCMLECSEQDHDHEVDTYSTEKIALGIIDIFQSIRQTVPGVWMETTCFGWNPSPWWLWYVNSVLGNHGDDVPFGRVPAPVYRESYTSARDFFNLQGTAGSLIPPACQEVLGIVHQTPDCFMNDAVMTVMRGHLFLPLYLNPKFMSDTRWEKFAGFLKWARAKADLLKHTMLLLPASWSEGAVPDFTNEAVMPREPYGYAHWGEGEGLAALRNPWIEPAVYRMRIPEDAQKRGKLRVISVYPEERLYGKDVQAGEQLDIPLAPYETIVLSIVPEESQSSIAAAIHEKGAYIQSRVLSEQQTADSLGLEAVITNSAPRAELLVLAEGKAGLSFKDYRFHVNGREVTATVDSSADGFDHSWLPKVEQDWVFLRIPLEQGENHLQADLSMDSNAVSSCSAWVWATKRSEGGAPLHVNGLPQPDLISLDAVRLSKQAR
ncbi:alpha-galactosidase [Cohnella silvisoli]|uniref:Alpha-galactosidase n=1 Tax=Cohnella silvisoli TaxID=2873699 RepID=A0ABV1KLR9_9BACL|nr:alpha-galactosidase [Cohnella silvisoli]MCD9020625.1 alpha-galactosidase [Cohnella silvisoli]